MGNDSIVNIIINTVKRGGGDKDAVSGIRKLTSGFKDLTGVSLTSMTAMGAVGAAVGGVSKFLKDAVNDTVEYATQVDNMSRLLGISAEDTSRLVQASDDLFISQEKLQAGLTAATRQGIDVSIEGLKALSEQYVSLPEGVERSEFVLKKYGRSGAEMGKLMEIGAAGIDEATAAIAQNMIISDRSMVEIMNYKRSVDNLNDSWQGLKYSIGQEVIPSLDLLMRQLTKGKDDIEVFELRLSDLNTQLLNLKKYGAQGGLSQEELARQIGLVEGAIDATYDEMSGYIDQQEELSNAAQNTRDYMSKLTQELIYNKAAETLSADAAFKLAKTMGMIPLDTELALNSITKWEQQLKDGKITEEEYIHLVNLLGDSLNRLPSEKFVHIVVDGKILESAREAATFGAGRDIALHEGATQQSRALGGPVEANRPYWVGENGIEVFIPKTSGEIVPNHRLGGNQIQININGAGDPNQVANAVMRKLRLQGVG